MRNLTRHLAVAVVLGLSAAVAGAAEVPQPRLGLFIEKADIERARQRAETLPWAKEYRDRVVAAAEEWAGRSDEWVRDIMPKPGERFAYGTAGCPKCSKGWKAFGRDTASLDRPRVLVCPHCKTEFDVTKTEGEFADTGTGVVVDGRRFWLRGTWNGFVVDTMWSGFNADSAAVVVLADAYALTGDERYAAKAAVIMDALATLAPQTIGPRDFDADPDKDMGRLQHLTSIMYRAQVHFARALDLLGDRPEFKRESVTNPGKTVWDNIRHGIFDEYLFKEFDNRGGKLFTLHNHEADSVRSVLLAGLIFGIPDYVRWGASGMGAFFDNTIDRDGLYYETSLSYTEFTRSVFVDMAEMLVRYDPAKYPAAAKMPRRDELPYGGNYFNHPKLARLTLDQPTRVSILGRKPTFGNNHFDTGVWKNDGRAFSRPEFQQAQRFVMYATDGEIRKKAERQVGVMAPFSGQNPLGGWWQLYRAPDIGAPGGGSKEPVPEGLASDLLGQAGLTFLRSGAGATRRGAVMRVGTNLPHSHDDAGALLLFANGRALSGDLGYGIFGNHVHLGWANRAIAHNVVVVNQDQSTLNRLFRMGPGGTITRFHEAAGVKWVETEMSRNFPETDGIKEYRRLVLQMDLGADTSYWVDLFDVDGGTVHDYSFHARPLGEKGSFEISGATPAAVDGAWTLAGLNPQYEDASFDQQGRSWGERLTVNGLIRKLPGVTDEVPEKSWWYAPPGNGYGFLHDVKSANTSTPWSATWRWDEKGDRYGLRLTMLPESSQQLIEATGPTLRGDDFMRWVVARSGRPGGTDRLRTRYMAVAEAFGAEPTLTEVKPVRQAGRVVGVEVAAKDGRQDLIVDARGGSVKSGDAVIDSGIGVVRRQGGQVVGMVLTGGTTLEAGGFAVRLESARLTGKVASVDLAAETFRVEPPLPASVVGSVLTVDSPSYSHGSAYRIGGATTDGEVTPLNSGITLGRATVDELNEDGFVATAPLVYGYEYDSDTRFLHGKQIVSGAKTAHVVGMSGFKDLKTTGANLSSGDAFVVSDVKPGDVVSIEATVSVIRSADVEEWLIQSSVPVAVRFPFFVETWENGAWSREPVDTVRSNGGVKRVRPASTDRR